MPNIYYFVIYLFNVNTLILTNQEQNWLHCSSLTATRELLNFYYSLVLNSLGLFAALLVSFYNNFPHCLICPNDFYNSVLLKRLKTALSGSWNQSAPLLCHFMLFWTGSKAIPKTPIRGRLTERGVEGHATCLPNKHNKAHLHVEQFSLKTVKNLLYNQSCKKDLHINQLKWKKEKRIQHWCELVPLTEELKEKSIPELCEPPCSLRGPSYERWVWTWNLLIRGIYVPDC